MKVQDLMSTRVSTCRVSDPLEQAARLMWDGDFGCVPVVDDASRIVGMVTDRDACMAAYTSGKPFASLSVEQAMAKRVECCREGDSVEEVLAKLGSAQLNRLPVVDAGRRLLGIVSLADVVQALDRDPVARRKWGDALLETLGDVTRPRQRSKPSAPAAPAGKSPINSEPAPPRAVPPLATKPIEKPAAKAPSKPAPKKPGKR